MTLTKNWYIILFWTRWHPVYLGDAANFGIFFYFIRKDMWGNQWNKNIVVFHKEEKNLSKWPTPCLLQEWTISSFNAFQYLFQSCQKWALIKGVVRSCVIWHLTKQRALKGEFLRFHQDKSQGLTGMKRQLTTIQEKIGIQQRSFTGWTYLFGKFNLSYFV